MFKQFSRRFFSSIRTTEFLPVVDLSHFIKDSSSSLSSTACKQLTESIYKSGTVVVKDPRADFKNNENFLNLFERYFASRSQMKNQNIPIQEMFPKNGYKTGVTPDYIEIPRDHSAYINALPSDQKPKSPLQPIKDPKWRYLFKMEEKGFIPKGDSIIDPPRVAPKDFPEFENTVDLWGKTLLSAVHTAAEMIEVGLELPKGTFKEKLKNGNSVAGPTGSDLSRYKKETVFAGIHYDISFMTIHGKSKFPGLYIWLHTGEKLRVVVPENCLLIQCGRELEYLTGGYLKAGFHEVIYDDFTEKAVEKAKKNGNSLWRVSSTLFSHVRPDVILEPLEKYSNEQSRKEYPKISAEEYTIKEFSYINLIEH